MTDLIRKFSPYDLEFGNRLNRYIIFHQFLEQSELLFVVSEYLSVSDILQLSAVSRSLRFLIQIPYIQIRILKCRLRKYEHPELNSRNQENQQIVAQYYQNIRKADRAMLRLDNKKRGAGYMRELLKFTCPNQNIKRMREQYKQIKTIIPPEIPKVEESSPNEKQQQITSSPDDSSSLTQNTQNKKIMYDIHQRFHQQLAKILAKREADALKYKRQLAQIKNKKKNQQLREFLIEDGKKITRIYKPRYAANQNQEQINFKSTVELDGYQIPIIQIEPGDRITINRSTDFITFKTLRYLKQAIPEFFTSYR